MHAYRVADNNLTGILAVLIAITTDDGYVFAKVVSMSMVAAVHANLRCAYHRGADSVDLDSGIVAVVPYVGYMVDGAKFERFFLCADCDDSVFTLKGFRYLLDLFDAWLHF